MDRGRPRLRTLVFVAQALGSLASPILACWGGGAPACAFCHPERSEGSASSISTACRIAGGSLLGSYQGPTYRGPRTAPVLRWLGWLESGRRDSYSSGFSPCFLRYFSKSYSIRSPNARRLSAFYRLLDRRPGVPRARRFCVRWGGGAPACAPFLDCYSLPLLPLPRYPTLSHVIPERRAL